MKRVNVRGEGCRECGGAVTSPRSFAASHAAPTLETPREEMSQTSGMASGPIQSP